MPSSGTLDAASQDDSLRTQNLTDGDPADPVSHPDVPEVELCERVSVVLLTYNCAHRLMPIVEELLALDLDIIAVDNASTDPTVELLRGHERMSVIALDKNIGAAARNVGLALAATPYVAFCDDDGWYERDGLARAADALDHHPGLGLVNARILVGDEQRLDPISAEMAASPLLDEDGMPGTVLLGFMAGACIVRASAYQAVGGYDPAFFMGGEEQELALKLVAAGWRLRYLDDVVVHHRPSQANVDRLRAFGLRNALWTCWIYRRPASVLMSTIGLLAERPKNRAWIVGVLLALRGLPLVLHRRRPLSIEVDRQLTRLDRHRPSFRRVHGQHSDAAPLI